MKGPYTHILFFFMLFLLGILIVLFLLRGLPSDEEQKNAQISIVFINSVNPSLTSNIFTLKEKRPEHEESLKSLNRILHEHKVERIVPDPRSPYHFKASFPPDTKTQIIAERLQDIPLIFFAQPISFVPLSHYAS